ncbi:MAG: BT_3044 domain-containing protein [Dysgonomonas sp.]
MKKILFICISILALSLNYSCNDELDDELFEKFVLLTQNGWIDQNLEITSTGLIEIPLVVSVNGTSDNDKTIAVGVKFDPDTLSGYNFEKYRNQTSLYYSELPSGAISFNDETITIGSNALKGISNMTLDLNKVADKYADYVVPVMIENTSEYRVAEDKYSKSLIHIVLKNSFSGNYTGEIGVYKTKSDGSNDTNNKFTVSTKTFYAISDDQCYFYAGQYDRTKTERNNFIVNITINDDETISMDSPNSDLNLKQEKASVEITSEPHPTDNRYEIVTTILTLQYTFKDLSLDDRPVVRAQGSVSMRQNVLIK